MTILCHMPFTYPHCAASRPVDGGLDFIHSRSAEMSSSVFFPLDFRRSYKQALFLARLHIVAGLRPVSAQYSSSSEMMA